MNDFINKKEKKLPVKKRLTLKQKFVKIVSSVVLSFFVIAALFTLAFAYLNSQLPKAGIRVEKPNDGIGIVSALEPPDIVTNIVVFGRDAKAFGLRTDVIFFVKYNTNGVIDIVSIPRDTKVDFTDEVAKEITEQGLYFPSTCKINEVHVYAGEKKRAWASTKMVESIIGEEIDYYVIIDLEGFREIVDAVGGVEMDVPQNMYYSDPTPGQELYINLEKGFQTLDGAKAEQLVRFRQYLTGDEERISVQQVFMKEFMKKVLSTESIMKNAVDYVRVFFQYVETDMPLTEAIKYVKYIDKISAEGMEMYTLPGEAREINAISYFLQDEAAVQILFDGINSGTLRTPPSAVSTEAIDVDDIDLKISVQNGGNQNGFAGKTEQNLELLGYDVVSINTFDGEKVPNTIFYVKEEGMGQELKNVFKTKVDIQVNSSKLPDGVDILVITGLDEE